MDLKKIKYEELVVDWPKFVDHIQVMSLEQQCEFAGRFMYALARADLTPAHRIAFNAIWEALPSSAIGLIVLICNPVYSNAVYQLVNERLGSQYIPTLLSTVHLEPFVRDIVAKLKNELGPFSSVKGPLVGMKDVPGSSCLD